jgi:integrase
MCEQGSRRFDPTAQLNADRSRQRIGAYADSKTATGIGDMPLTPAAPGAFGRQMEETPGSEYLFPGPAAKAKKPYMTNLRKVWAKTLEKAGVPYFASYELRHTFATRLSAAASPIIW